MSENKRAISIPVDVTNPGQFFACCGLLELAHRLYPGVEGWFDQDAFHITMKTEDEHPLETIIHAICECKIEADTKRGEEKTYPINLKFHSFELTLDWWLSNQNKGTRFKLWAGQQSSLKIIQELQAALKNGNKPLEEHTVFSYSLPLSSRFGVDPQAAWNAIDVGFSPNDQAMKVDTNLVIELLAGIGLQGFRSIESRPNYIYYTWSKPVPAIITRAVCVSLIQAGEMQGYQFQIVSRGSFKGFSNANLYNGENE